MLLNLRKSIVKELVEEMTEYEKKIIITEDEYCARKSLATKESRKILQTNYYYDTEHFDLCKEGITCRIRKKDNKYTATIKYHNKNEKESSVEKSVPAKNEFDSSLFDKMGVRLQGALFTERIIIFEDEGIEVALDKNTYLGINDYELEIEYSPDRASEAENLLEEFAHALYLDDVVVSIDNFIKRKEHPKSKSERFFERKKLL